MLTLNDGPAKGSYLVKRAPMYLRAVVNINGKADVLDQLDDSPRPRERVYVYHLVTGVGSVHLHMSGSARRASGFYVMAGYEYMPDVDGEAVRYTAAWQAWVREQLPTETVNDRGVVEPPGP